MEFLEVEDIEKLSRSIAFHAVRKGFIESIHGGTWPHSETGDYSDVKVVTPAGEIPWSELSRISEDEMKAFMKKVVNRLYTMLFPLIGVDEELAGYDKLIERGLVSTERWDRATFEECLMEAIALGEMDEEILVAHFEKQK
jgi:hypothetical protein